MCSRTRCSSSRLRPRPGIFEVKAKARQASSRPRPMPRPRKFVLELASRSKPCSRRGPHSCISPLSLSSLVWCMCRYRKYRWWGRRQLTMTWSRWSRRHPAVLCRVVSFCPTDQSATSTSLYVTTARCDVRQILRERTNCTCRGRHFRRTVLTPWTRPTNTVCVHGVREHGPSTQVSEMTPVFEGPRRSVNSLYRL